jgi:integrase/recombinase XerD
MTQEVQDEYDEHDELPVEVEIRQNEFYVAPVVPQQADNDAHLVELWLNLRDSPNTRRAYKRDAERFFDFANLEIREVRLGDFQQYVEHLRGEGYAPATVARRVHVVRSLYAFAHDVGYVPFNVTVPVKAPKVKDALAERIMRLEDVLRIIDREPDFRNRVLLRFLYASGARVSEVAGLHWRDCIERSTPEGEPDAGQVTLFGKGGKTRVVLLSSATWQELVSLRKTENPDEAVFPSKRTGTALTTSAIFRVVKAAAQRAGMQRPSPHWLRHAHASHALDRGAPLHLVQATLGHQNVATTGRYLHARPDDSSSMYLPV